jgi:hypothetical protein
MMNELDISNELRELCVYFCPTIKDIIYYDSPITFSTWKAEIETGKAVEFTALCATISSFQKLGYELSVPSLYDDNPDLFYLRNVIPRHHDAQAGHNAAFINQVPLHDRFIASLTPKVILRNSVGCVFSIFREGHAVHKIAHLLKNDNEYLDRPDIVISQGEMVLPKISTTEIEFLYMQDIGDISGVLRIRNDSSLPIISFNPEAGADILINGIIECSVGKGIAHAIKQVHRYKTLFASVIIPEAALVNGQRGIRKPIEHEILIDLTKWDRRKTIDALEEGFDKFSKIIAATSRMI